MAAVYAVTAGSGESYHIERVYLDADQAYRFAQAYNGISPVEPVQVEEWQVGAPPAAYAGPLLAGAVVGANPGQQAVQHAAGHRRGRTLRRLRHPSGVVDRGGIARGHGVPKIEVVGRSKEKVEEIFWEEVTQVRAELAGMPWK